MPRHFSSKHRLVYILFALELRIQHILLPLLSSASELVRNTCHCRRRDRLWSLACAALLSFFWYCSMRFILTTFTCKTVIQSLCWYHERGHVYSRIHLRHCDGIRYTWQWHWMSRFNDVSQSIQWFYLCRSQQFRLRRVGIFLNARPTRRSSIQMSRILQRNVLDVSSIWRYLALLCNGMGAIAHYVYIIFFLLR